MKINLRQRAQQPKHPSPRLLSKAPFVHQKLFKQATQTIIYNLLKEQKRVLLSAYRAPISAPSSAKHPPAACPVVHRHPRTCPPPAGVQRMDLFGLVPYLLEEGFLKDTDPLDVPYLKTSVVVFDSFWDQCLIHLVICYEAKKRSSPWGQDPRMTIKETNTASSALQPSAVFDSCLRQRLITKFLLSFSQSIKKNVKSFFSQLFRKITHQTISKHLKASENLRFLQKKSHPGRASPRLSSPPSTPSSNIQKSRQEPWKPCSGSCACAVVGLVLG